ncbi:hypothetical protein F5Y15DRAFT_429113 [Xylariaceae sp. FL0016]|nr:hypothetical protein F5Y15DRAFT_429113 [Xylariaceae sp. FL0016]
MCRKIITHHMHHDVASPMIIGPLSESAPIYANPLHTNWHRCEVTIPPRGFRLSGGECMHICEYHSCCTPSKEIEWCEDMVAELEQYEVEPEACELFTLVHHHERLEYFGLPDLFQEPVPTTWRYLAQIRCHGPDWMPDFAHDGWERIRFEEIFFAQCEKLYLTAHDALIHYNVSLDLAMDERLAAQADSYFWRAKQADFEQRKIVSDMLDWAYQPCGSCWT